MISFTIIAIILIVALFVLLFIARKENTRLLTELKEEKEKTKDAKVEAALLALILSRLSLLVKTNLSPLNLTKLPFKLVGGNESIVLTSIRFKEVHDQALVYINGAMAPYTGQLKLNHPNSFSNNNFKDIDEVLITLKHKQLTGADITAKLKEINEKLNK